MPSKKKKSGGQQKHGRYPPAHRPSDTLEKMLRNQAGSSSASPGLSIPGPSAINNLRTPEMSRKDSVSTTIGVPLAKVDLAAEREEGEISDEEGKTASSSIGDPGYRSQLGQPSSSTPGLLARIAPAPRGSPRSPAQPRPITKQMSNATSALQSRPPTSGPSQQRAPPKPQTQAAKAPSIPPQTASASGSGGPVNGVSAAVVPPMRTSPGPLSSASPTMTVAEARQYMDVIKGLLQEGFSPDVLIRKGATARFVTAVCEEIVEQTKRRKSLWTETRSAPSSAASSSTPIKLHINQSGPPASTSTSLPPQRAAFVESSSAGPSREQSRPPHSTAETSRSTQTRIQPGSLAGQKRERSGSSEVEIMVSMERRGSLSSEGSAEILLFDSPPVSRRRILPSSSWTPPVPSSMPTPSSSLPPSVPLPIIPALTQAPSLLPPSGPLPVIPALTQAPSSLPPAVPQPIIPALTQAPVRPPPIAVPSHPIKIESYKPPPSGPSRPSLPFPLPAKPTTPIPSGSMQPSSGFESVLASRAAVLPSPTSSTQPSPTGSRRSSRQAKKRGSATESSLLGNPEMEQPTVTQPAITRFPDRPPVFAQISDSIPADASAPSSSTSIPAPTAPSLAAAAGPATTDVAAKNAMLEARRKILEKKRAAAGLATTEQAANNAILEAKRKVLESRQASTGPVISKAAASNSIVEPKKKALESKPVPTGPAAAELAAKNAILEARRKVLESMKRRKATKPEEGNVKMEVDSTTPPSQSSTPAPAAPSLTTETQARQKIIEQEVLDLEREMIGLQEAADAEVAPGPADDSMTTDATPAPPSPSPSVSMEMDVDDEPEDGEIIPSSVPNPTSMPSPLPIFASSLPARPSSRGLKRPNAEDLESRPISAPIRIRKKPFGGPQRPNRLLINLDDIDSSDEEDEPPISASGTSTPVLSLLAEKEEKIRQLKAQIAEKMRKARESKRAKIEEGGSAAGSPAPEPVSGGTPPQETVPSIAQPAIPAQVTPLANGSKAEEVEMEVDKPSTSATTEANDATKGLSEMPPEADLFCRPEPSDRGGMKWSIHALALLLACTDFSPPQPKSHLPPTATTAPAGALPFKSYQPLLSRYPQLSAASYSESFPQFNLSRPQPDSSPTDLFGTIDRGLLSAIILTHRIQRDPNAIMCLAEVSGGICADGTCEAVHLNKGDPTEEDLVEYAQQLLSQRSNRPSPARTTLKAAVRTVLQWHTTKAKPGLDAKANLLGSDEALAMVMGKIGGLLPS